MKPPDIRTRLKITVLALAPTVASGHVWAETPVTELRIRDHLFFPATINVPAHTKVKLLVSNEDATAEEFESYELNREKIIPGGRKAVIFIGPLPPGEYPFFGEFFPKTAQGKVIAE